MQLLFHSIESLYRRVRFATLTQKILELIHRAGLTGQAGTVLQCLHGGSPLAYVVHVSTSLSQSGDAPSSGSRTRRSSLGVRASTFLHQYVIYTR